MALPTIAGFPRLRLCAIAVSLALGGLPALALGQSGDAPKTEQPAVTPVATIPPLEEEGSRPMIRVGVLVGLSIPRPVSFEFLVKVWDLFGVGFGYSVLPSAMSVWLLSAYGVHNASVDSSGLELDLRVFPLRGRFFLGASLGRQTLTATDTQQGITGKGDMTTIYVTPRLGWLWILDSGISFGADLGVQIPLSYEYTVTPP